MIFFCCASVILRRGVGLGTTFQERQEGFLLSIDLLHLLGDVLDLGIDLVEGFIKCAGSLVGFGSVGVGALVSHGITLLINW